MNKLDDFIEKYGSDKKLSGYTQVYDLVFDSIRNKVKNLLEIGVGTLDASCPSSFVGNPSLYPHYKPGGSLRAWRDYFPNSFVEGVDIGKDCLFEEDRIKTFIADSQDTELCNKIFGNKTYDIIIDDGLHTAIGQLRTLKNFFNRVVDGGYYVIEDLGGGGEGLNMFDFYKKETEEIIGNHEYFFGGNILVIKKNNSKKGLIHNPIQFLEPQKLTLVTGLWNIGRPGRDFDHYLASFEKLLEVKQNMFIYIPKEYESFVWERRSTSNTFVKTFELEDIKNLYSPFWDKTQQIRTNPDWYNQTGEQGWLKSSPQAYLEWYNPIVQSKMFLLHDVTIWNPFNTEYFIWIDAGITNTVHEGYLTEQNTLDKIVDHLDPFLFLSYPYEANTEIHGFKFDEMNKLCDQKVEYVCRGGLFGGNKSAIAEANSEYYGILNSTLSAGLMGTEESIFTIMSYLYPEKYRRYELDANGLIVKFIQALNEQAVSLTAIPKEKLYITRKNVNVDNLKVSVYMLTFNFTHQVEHTIQTWLKHDKFLKHTRNILIDNSTNDEARETNKAVCEKYNFEHIITNENTGINGGRFRAAQHFQESDSDYYLFLEDDMGIYAPEETGFCRNGLKTYVPNLYNKILRIMHGSDIDFLKLSYTEVFMDNNIQVSWYNVPQTVRSEFWPHYDNLPVTGLDMNCPRTQLDTIEVVDGLSYVTGEIYYCNWPMIVGKKGNQKMFLDTTWARPYEQTWMSYMFQETKKGNLKPAVLLASPINHNRIAHYEPEERREN
jgi:hypothetical protein